jgi:hypothetical protein
MPQDMTPPAEPTEAGNIGTPLQALRAHCVECCNGSFAEVRACPNRTCALWPFRHGRGPTPTEREAVAGQPVHPLERTLAGTSALKAVKRRCLDCSGNDQSEVRSCSHTGCSLHSFRAGKNPNIVRTPERKEADARRLAALRASALPKIPAGNPQSTPSRVPARVTQPKKIAAAG